MSPIRQTSLLVLLVSALACHESTGLAAATEAFVLQDVSGRSLPTFLAATPGLATTIVSGSLILDDTGRASIMEHRINYDGTETDETVNYTYTISGTHMEFEPVNACPADAICVAPPRGTIVGGLVSLERYPPSDFIVYNYRIAQPD